jgi:hypothetical protein
VPPYLTWDDTWDDRVGAGRTEALRHAQLREEASAYRLALSRIPLRDLLPRLEAFRPA